MVERMIRAARLDASVYNEVERDLSATTQAFMVVIVVALASGIGSAITMIFGGHAGQAIGSLIGGVIMSLISWCVWSFLTYFIGTKVFGGRATPGELLRCTAFGYSPGVITIVSFIPVLGGLVGLAALVWQVVAEVIAIREALDVDTSKAVLTAVISVVILLVVFAVLAGILAAIGLGAFALMGGLGK